MNPIIFMLKVVACQAVLFGIYKLFLSKLTFFHLNRWSLYVCLLVPVLLPLLPLSWLTESSIWSNSIWANNVVLLEPIEVTLESWNQLQYSEFSLLNLIPFVYWIGLMVASMLFSWRLFNVVNLIRKHPTTHIEKRVCIVVEDMQIASFFNYLFVPPNFDLHPNRLFILKHEEAHMKQLHSMDVLFVSVFQIVFWFNPLVYLIKKEMLLNHEFLADAAVLKEDAMTAIPIQNNNFSIKKNYVKAILENTTHLQLQLTNPFFHSQIKQRIMMLQKKKSNANLRLNYLSLCVAMFGLLMIFACQKDNPAETNAAALSKTEATTVKEDVKETTGTDEVFQVVEEMPEFPGGQQKMLEFIYKNIKYPAAAREEGLEGLVVIRFVVDKEGNTKDHEIVRGGGGGMGEEALRVVKTMPQWKPGKQKGKKVAVSYNLPVRFKLQ